MYTQEWHIAYDTSQHVAAVPSDSSDWHPKRATLRCSYPYPTPAKTPDCHFTGKPWPYQPSLQMEFLKKLGVSPTLYNVDRCEVSKMQLRPQLLLHYS